MTRLSIIVTFYDETAFVQMAVSSILAQGIADIEVIVVNDNPDVFGADYFAGLNLPEQVRVVHHPENRGLSAARNSGIAAASGSHLGFLDADDYYVSDGLVTQWAEAQASGADITHAPCYLSRARSPQVELLPRDRKLFMTAKRTTGLIAAPEAQFITSSWSSLYRRDFLDRFQLGFDVAQPRFEDRLFVLQTVTKARSIAFTGRPARVWRRRAGSISRAESDPETERLKLQLIEKCMSHIRAEVAAGTLPPRFERRELFNTVSRLIWDMGILDLIATETPQAQDFAARIPALLGADSFGNQIFDDPDIAAIHRVGQRTRRGRIRREDFFDLHKQMRSGNFAEVQKVLSRCADKPAARAAPSHKRRVFLHLGMHKTGSTYLQNQMLAHREALLRRGLLFPRAGLADSSFRSTRNDGFPGHNALLSSLRTTDDSVWQALRHEAKAHPRHDLILSCENMLLPFSDDREQQIQELLNRLAPFGALCPLALVRRADTAIESHYREVVSNGARMGSRTITEFLVDAGPALTDLPALFAPFEAAAAQPTRFLDYDAARVQGSLWREFQTLLHPDPPLPDADVPRYRSLGRATIETARIANTQLADTDLRLRVLQDFFRTAPTDTDRMPLLSPPQRQELLRSFHEHSAAFCKTRGYDPDVQTFYDDIRQTDWSPLTAIPIATLEAMNRARLRCETPAQNRPARTKPDTSTTKPKGWTLTIRPRPWVTRLTGRLTRRP